MDLLRGATVLVLAALGCSSDEEPPPRVLDASMYARDCAQPSDCVKITAGDVCTCLCANAAIGKAAEAQYDADVQAGIAAHCPGWNYATCGACPPSTAPDCKQGSCVP
ncbi:MAG: hypothetical protein HY744_03405 [Deltaproteobacteria bacterium]|nr:hypothetical protein [Deltaproteobacteria bacterium]